MRYKKIPGFLMIGVLFCSAQAWAASKNLEIGARTQTLYDSNVFFAQNNPVSDMMTSVGPTLVYTRNNGKHTRLMVDASSMYQFYYENEDLNDLNFSVSETLLHDLGPHWVVGLSNTNIKESTSYLTDTLVGATGRFEYKFNSLTPSATYNSHSGTVVTTSATFDRISYDDPAVSNSQGDRVTVAASHALDAMISAVADVSYQEQDFDNGVAVDVLLGDMGFIYSPTRRQTHTVKIGAQSIDQGVGETSEQLYYLYQLVYELSRKTSLTLYSQRQSAIIDSQNNVLDIWQTVLSLSRKLTRRDTLEGTLSYVIADYDSLNGQDIIEKAEISLEHVLSKHVSLKAGYSYEDKSSDLNSGYSRHMVTVSLAAKF